MSANNDDWNDRLHFRFRRLPCLRKKCKLAFVHTCNLEKRNGHDDLLALHLFCILSLFCFPILHLGL